MPKPACIPCGRFFRPLRNGVYLAENMPEGAEVPPGQPEGWVNYKIWTADSWKCQGCGAEIVTGYGQRPVSEHYQPDFASWLAMATVTVNDC